MKIHFKHCLLLLPLLAFSIFASTAAPSETYNKKTRAEVERFVKQAVCYTLQHGRQQALIEFSRKHGKFTIGNVYIFAYNYKGSEKGFCVAHPYHPEFIGKDKSKLKAVQKLIITAERGGGWTNYKWDNPKTGGMENKSGYVLPVPGEDFFVGSGYYSE